MADLAQQPRWLTRNRRWIVLGCLGLVVIVVGFTGAVLYGVHYLMKSGDAYNMALKRVHSDAQVKNILGSPVSEGWYVAGSVETSPTDGKADQSFPISGPTGTGTAYFTATKSMGKWTLDRLEVAIDGQSNRLILIPANGAKTPGPTPEQDDSRPDP